MLQTVTNSVSPIREVFDRQPDSPAVLVADGHGIHISVARGHLIIEDGIGATRRTRKIPRMPREVARLVILGSTGYVTLEAVRWLADLDITLIQLDRDGRLLMSSPGQAGDARLRAAQVHAAEGERNSATGRAVVASLVAAKLTGQAAVLRDVLRLSDSAVKIDGDASHVLTDATVNGIEGQAASVYWRGWKGNVHVPFSPHDLSLVPPHWYGFKARSSVRNPLLQGKNATDPVNAMLNYAYAIGETEARNACYIAGLDPALGFGHGQHRGTDALVYDLLEPIRPLCDRAVLSLLDTGYGAPVNPATGRPAYLKLLWFCETGSGVCRLVAPLTHMVAERVSAAVADTVRAQAAGIARMLASTSVHKLRASARLSSVLTGPPVTVQRHERWRVTQIAPDMQPAELVTDDVWERVRALIPPEPVAARHKTERSDARNVLAGIICHEVLGSAWKSIPVGFGVSWNTCRRRLTEWQDLGAWPAILAEVKR